MSHFAILVRVPGAAAVDDIEPAVRELLKPYKESGSEEEMAPYQSFKDIEDESRKSFETGHMGSVRFIDGQEFDKYDARFKKKASGPLSFDEKYEHPEGAVIFDKPFTARYADFETYMREYEGYKERDPKTNRYGYMRNPNAKWDWYTIGGRWMGGVLRLKHDIAESGIGRPGLMTERGEGPDFCRIESIDFDHAAETARKKVAEAWEEWQMLCNDTFPEDKDKSWARYDARDTAHGLGLIVCKDESELTGKEWKKVLWPRQNTPGVNRYDVLIPIEKDEFTKKFANYFDPIRTYAYVDHVTGWQAPGRMGWWGISHEETDERMAFTNNFYTWLRGGDQHDWIVVIDCHI